jgi:hypothetical protein
MATMNLGCILRIFNCVIVEQRDMVLMRTMSITMYDEQIPFARLPQECIGISGAAVKHQPKSTVSKTQILFDKHAVGLCSSWSGVAQVTLSF